MSTQQVETVSATAATIERECAHHGCDEAGEHSVYGVPLCMIHWLRDRVRVNLTRLS